MPSSNPLSFLRPLYDIAVWQFILMSGNHHATAGGESPRNKHIKFTRKMHEVVANFLCKLLEVRAFNHLQTKLLGEQEKRQLEIGKLEKVQQQNLSNGARISGEERIHVFLGAMQLSPKMSR